MDQAQAIDILSLAVFTILKAAGPVLTAALGIGLTIAFFQALTQIQEMTLTFIPKIVGIFLVLILSLPWIFQRVNDFILKIFDLIRIAGVS
ncbi:flagellar biosynthesis protein FliQ [Salipiger sp. PrR003]|uniref:flagellar biosynthesis protein FliQ n=1 Tax=Salipiger sp. PrR003 TaxID=2706776 RepID=UPI0013DB85F5|nr:flagellar biosynthesis protein FliQ [Salipiger sp. PrR003]NDV50808.1 flagellar biosynthesis protein FliQ [Salipiger sp. PrR003]